MGKINKSKENDKKYWIIIIISFIVSFIGFLIKYRGEFDNAIPIGICIHAMGWGSLFGSILIYNILYIKKHPKEKQYLVGIVILTILVMWFLSDIEKSVKDYCKEPENVLLYNCVIEEKEDKCYVKGIDVEGREYSLRLRNIEYEKLKEFENTERYYDSAAEENIIGIKVNKSMKIYYYENLKWIQSYKIVE